MSSNWSTVYSGVPQGSGLGTLFFNIYVNDIPSIIDSQTLIFVDDTKIYRKVKSKADFLQFQEDINRLLDWSTQWQLKFNISKCHILHLGPSYFYGNYYLDGSKITTESSVRDLGVTIDNCLKFHNHTNLTITKANCIQGFISKIFQYKELDMIIKLYKSLARPIVEYGNPVWGPYYITYQRSIEGVQRHATKLVPSIRHHTYPERLQILNLPSLYYR